MFIRCAFFQGQVRPGQEQAFNQYIRDKLVPLAEDINGRAVNGLTPDEIAIMRRGLHLMIQNLATYEEDSVNERRRVPSTRELSRMARGEPARPPARPPTSTRPVRLIRP
jgi:hypothetical protein